MDLGATSSAIHLILAKFLMDQEQETDFCQLTHKWSKVVKKHKNKSLYPLQKFLASAHLFQF